MKPLKILVPAEIELHEATTWYRERDPRVADRFAAEVRKTLRLIEQFPQIGGYVFGIHDRHVRRMPIHAFPYSIVFDDLGDSIEVVAFAHNRRRPAYFMARLRRS
ncbi:MAG TPA: type II toxin-antitoxin system RelE/ParE family toxin [Thermoanaerobaculia bacterium]|nr:type II toxin-antitoxin system RelE/ParE family toxin [Thermoanaerobaculia bacterium]